MNYGKIYYCDVANGTGCRTVLFVSGCRHHCKGCFNPETWSFDFGDEYTKEVEDRIIESLAPEYITGLTVLGGEPMEPENQPYVARLLKRAKKEQPDKTVWVYSGYTWEQLHDPACLCRTDVTDGLLSCVDVLVDGEFVLESKNIRLKFRGSENQRLIDVSATLKNGEIVLFGV